MFDTILLAIDASSNDESVLSCAQKLATHYRSKVVVVFVGAASSVTRRVHQQIKQLRERGVHARLAVVADGRDRASVIAHMATAWSADLVIVGGGSCAAAGLTQRVVETLACPVLAVPGPADVG